MGLFDMFSGGSSKVSEYLANGAMVIDVRTTAEFQGGHVAGSKNFPLQNLNASIKQLKSLNKPLVLCCASGMRSGQATSMLKSEGVDCINGGGWMKVNGLLATTNQ